MKRRRKITIEKDIPIPEINPRGPRTQESQALIEMKVGDSFVIDDSRKIYSAARWFKIKIKVRKTWEIGRRKWKFRVWKMANPPEEKGDA